MKIVGIRKESGVYQEKPWTSYSVTCEHEKKESDLNLWGSSCDVFRIKGSDFDKFCMMYSIKDASELLGKNIVSTYYNAYGKVSGFGLGE